MIVLSRNLLDFPVADEIGAVFCGSERSLPPAGCRSILFPRMAMGGGTRVLPRNEGLAAQLDAADAVAATRIPMSVKDQDRGVRGVEGFDEFARIADANDCS